MNGNRLGELPDQCPEFLDFGGDGFGRGNGHIDGSGDLDFGGGEPAPELCHLPRDVGRAPR